jgi:hypothetical protein
MNVSFSRKRWWSSFLSICLFNCHRWEETFVQVYRYNAYQIEYRNFHHALVEISSPVFDNFDGNHFLSFKVLAFHYLPKCTLTKDV